VRFALDRLRERDGFTSDIRWGALTFAQWACVGLFAFGVGVVVRMRRPPKGAASRSPDPRPAPS
jgi:hypothetical protein